MVPLPLRDQRHAWLRYEGQEYTDEIIHNFEERLGRIFDRQVNRVQVLDFKELIKETGQAMTERLRMEHIVAQGKIMIASDADFLGVVPSYTSIRDSLERLCHRLLAFSISGRGQAPEKGIGCLGGHLVARLAEHFGLITKESLRELTMVVCDLIMIDMDEMARFHIHERLGDT
ncbi:hypothetical protein Tco_0295305 [Tanacetum coccineum]